MEAGTPDGRLTEQPWKEGAGMDLSERLDEGKMKWSEIQEEVATGLVDWGRGRGVEGDSWFLTLVMGWWNHYRKKRLEGKGQEFTLRHHYG